MKRLREEQLTIGLRLLIGLLGALSLTLGLLLTATELRWAYVGSPPVPTLAAALVCLLGTSGGAYLLRGAWRGRIGVRRTRGR
jgi:hypothetical protein